jgi:hypothetical protein
MPTLPPVDHEQAGNRNEIDHFRYEGTAISKKCQ